MKKKILSIMLALCMVLTMLPITEAEAAAATYDLAQGSVTIDDNSPENITINGRSIRTANTIKIIGTKNHTVTLNELNINSTNRMISPVAVDSSGTTTLKLSNINSLYFDAVSKMAAVRKTAQGTLIIAGSGTLSASGGYFSDGSGGAAIGGNDGESTANIIIQSGTIQAASLSCAAAIGGGNMGSATNIQITGGNVYAESSNGAAIGGGGTCQTGSNTTYTGRNIVISGGTVKAYAHNSNKCMAIGDGNVGYSDGYGMDTSGWGNVLQPPTGMVSKVEYEDNGTKPSFNGNYGTNQKADITRFYSVQISFVAGHRLTVQNGAGSGLYLAGKPVNISAGDEGYIEFRKWTLNGGSAAIANTAGKSTTLTMGSTDVTVTAVKAINYDSLKFALSPVSIKGASGKTQQFMVGASYNGTALTADQMAGLSYTTTWSLTDAANSTISSTGLLTMGTETANIKVNAVIQAGGKTYPVGADVLYKEAEAGDLIISGGLPGTDYTYADNVLTFTGSGTYLVGMKPGVATAATRIVVNGGSPKITLQNVKIGIDSNAQSIFCVLTGSPSVTISGTNSLINYNSNDNSNGIRVMSGHLTLDGGDIDTLDVQGNYYSVIILRGGSLTIKGGHYLFGKSSYNIGSIKVDYNATCEVLGGIMELQSAYQGRDCNVITADGDFRIIPAEGKQAAYKVKDSTKYLTEPYSTGTVKFYKNKIAFSDSLPAITAVPTGAENTSAGITVNGTSSATGYYRLYEGGVSSTPLAGDIMGSAAGTVDLSKDVASSVSLTGLKEGTTYDCCIVAAAGSGESTQVSKVVKVRFTTLLAVPAAGDTSIDYTEEYLKAADTLASGTVLQYANTENAVTWTDFPTGGVRLTSLLDSHTGTDDITLYVRKKAGNAYSAAVAVSIPSRPSCSVSSLDISYANETVTVPMGVIYQFSVQSPSSWSGAMAGMGSAVTLSPYISAAGTAENTWNKVFFRNPASANSFASKAAAVEIPARPSVTAPTMSAAGLTFASITLNPVTDAEYKLTKINGNAVENAQYQASNVFADLNPVTKYTFVQRLLAVEKTAGADGHFASVESAPAEFTTAELTVLYNGSAKKAKWYTGSANISGMGYTVSDTKNGMFADSYTVSETCTNKTLYFKNASGVVTPFAVSVNIDKTAPTGKITVGASTWDKFLTVITFGCYHADPNAVTIESSDGESGVKTTQYLIATEGTTYTKDELAAKAGDDWQTYSADSKPALTEGQKSVVYAKITDNMGLVTYLCSDGVILDNTAPTISELKATETKDTGASFAFTATEAGTYYYEVLPKDAPAPTVDKLLSGTKAAMTAGTNGISVSGLTANTDYVIYAAARDVAGNKSALSHTAFKTKLTPMTASFDKYASSDGYKDISVTLTLSVNTLSGISNGSAELAKGTDYTVSGSTVTIKKEYLVDLSTGDKELTFKFSAGTTQTLTVSVTDSTPMMSPPTANFNKYASSDGHKDISVTLMQGKGKFSGIFNGAAELVKDTDYSVSDDGSTVKILKSYLAKQSVGVTTLTFHFGAGSDAALKVTVSDSTPGSSTISPTLASFDKNTEKQADITVTLTLKGNTLSGIKNGNTELAKDTDYTVSDSTVTIKKEYLADLKTGNTKLVFHFSTGVDQTLTVTVGDAASSSGIISAFESLGSAVSKQSVAFGTTFSKINLPSLLKAAVDGVSNMWVKVTEWVSSVTYNPQIPGTYDFTPVLDSGYRLENSGVQLPHIRVTVNTHSSCISTPSLPSSVTHAASHTEVTLSGASFSSNVTQITLSVTPETPDGIPKGVSGGTADPQGAAAYKLAVSNTTLNVIGTPLLYDMKLLDQNGNAVSFTGSVTVRSSVPAGLRGTPHVFRYEESTGTLADMNATVENGFLMFSTTHFSNYIVAGTGDSITLDTKSYQMPVNGSYQIGVKLTGSKTATVKVHSTNDRTATAAKLTNGNVQVNGKNPGTVWIMIDVYDNKNHLLTHASVRVDVKTGIRPRGDSTRQIGIF